MREVPVSSSGLPRAFVASAPLAVALGVATLTLMATAGLDAQQATIVAFELAIAWGYVGAGLWAVGRERATRVGVLTIAVGCGLFLNAWLFSDRPLTYTVGLLFGVLWTAAMFHLVLAFPSGWLQRPVERWLIAAAYTTAGLLHVLPWLFWGGGLASVCDDCPRNLVLLTPNGGLATALFVLHIGVSAVVVVWGLWYFVLVRWWRAGARERYELTPAVSVLLAFAVLITLAAVALAIGLPVIAVGLAFGYFVAVGALPFALLAGLQRRRTARAEAVGRLARRLSTVVGPDDLRDALAEALGDPTLEIAYWVSEREEYRDGRGREVAADGQAWTEIRHEQRLLAAIVHDPSMADEPELVSVAGATLALALERERLAAALRANVRELRASRARIVKAGDDARRRLERDLHDGAQQRLVSLLLNVQLGRRDGAPAWDGLEEELADALTELRALASGILPPALSDHGLEAAVQDLAARSAIDVTIGDVPHGRLPERIEIAAYFVIAEALANVAKHAHATAATVSVTASDDRVYIEVSDDGVGGAAPERGSGLRGLTDRLEALDGSLSVVSEPGAGTTVRAELPLAAKEPA